MEPAMYIITGQEVYGKKGLLIAFSNAHEFRPVAEVGLRKEAEIMVKALNTKYNETGSYTEMLAA